MEQYFLTFVGVQCKMGSLAFLNILHQNCNSQEREFIIQIIHAHYFFTEINPGHYFPLYCIFHILDDLIRE